MQKQLTALHAIMEIASPRREFKQNANQRRFVSVRLENVRATPGLYFFPSLYSGNFLLPLTVNSAAICGASVPGCPPPIVIL
jgi:hypothetical protein